MDLSNENIIHVKKNGIEYLQFRKLLEYGILNCYTTKINDLDFNLKLEKEKQEYSYKRLCDTLEIDRKSIITPMQTHTDVVKRVDQLNDYFDNVDGLITDKKNFNLVLFFADCTPVLIYDPVKKAIANIHSGWKGTAKKLHKRV